MIQLNTWPFGLDLETVAHIRRNGKIQPIKKRDIVVVKGNNLEENGSWNGKILKYTKGKPMVLEIWTEWSNLKPQKAIVQIHPSSF
ncbi:MAG: hypothetical protein GF387_02775 [Candidatus Portnoybacteria bacterium]|nr:hypothetical protein [Candidatus Portnoybacteria bacterium]